MCQGQYLTVIYVLIRIWDGIARIFQLVTVFDQLGTLDNVVLAIFSREGKTRRLLSLASSDHPVREEAFEVLREFGIESMASKPAGGLSHGERKLVDVDVAYALRTYHIIV